MTKHTANPMPNDLADEFLGNLEILAGHVGNIRTVEEVSAIIELLKVVQRFLAKVGAYADSSKLPTDLEVGDRIVMADGATCRVLFGTWPTDPYTLAIPYTRNETDDLVEGIFMLDVRIPVPVEVAA